MSHPNRPWPPGVCINIPRIDSPALLVRLSDKGLANEQGAAEGPELTGRLAETRAELLEARAAFEQSQERVRNLRIGLYIMRGLMTSLRHKSYVTAEGIVENLAKTSASGLKPEDVRAVAEAGRRTPNDVEGLQAALEQSQKRARHMEVALKDVGATVEHLIDAVDYYTTNYT